MAAEDNKTIVRRLLEEPWTGNLGIVDEYVDADYVGYDASQPEPLRGPQAVKEFIQIFLSGFSDGRITVDHQFAEGDMVATRWTGRGTHDGELMGIAPTRKQVTVPGINISKVKNGKVVEEWSNWDTLGMLQQLGAVPEPARA
jgi:predicted ester cyclase